MVRIIKNKKGMFFLFVAIALLTLSLASVSVFSEIKTRETIGTRIKAMNTYVFSLEEDLERKLFISGFRIIFLHEKRIVDTGNYILDIESSFNEAFFNGTIEGSSTAEEDSLLTGVTFDDIMVDINANSNSLGLGVSFEDPNISISQVDPWNIKVSLQGQLLISDFGNLASWNRSETIEILIPTENFEDPIYVINTNARVVPKVNQTPYSQFVEGSNITNLTNHNENFYYIASNTAPSFLNRMEGNLSAHPQGVESLVDLAELSAQGFSILDKSIVDYIYFSSDNPSTNGVIGTPFWFKLDSDHHDVYNVSGILI